MATMSDVLRRLDVLETSESLEDKFDVSSATLRRHSRFPSRFVRARHGLKTHVAKLESMGAADSLDRGEAKNAVQNIINALDLIARLGSNTRPDFEAAIELLDKSVLSLVRALPFKVHDNADCVALPNYWFTPEELGDIFSDVDKLW